MSFMHLSFVDLIIRLAVAAMLGAVVGIERESASKGAGPLLRSLEDSNGRVLHMSVEDDDRDANGDGVRRVTIDVGLRHNDDIDRIIDEMRSRPEVRALRISDSEDL